MRLEREKFSVLIERKSRAYPTIAAVHGGQEFLAAIADPLHRLDCCVISDGGGALVIAKPEIAKSLKRPKVKIIGVGEANKIQGGGVDLDLTYSGGRDSGKAAFEMAGVKPSDIKYASLYDSFTITVVMQIEDLGFCEKGKGGKFVADGNLISGVGKLPFNTDGGGLSRRSSSKT